jgi:hypothetical protein
MAPGPAGRAWAGTSASPPGTERGMKTQSQAQVANTEHAAAWDGHEGEHWTEHADRDDRAGRVTGNVSSTRA